MTPIRVDSTSVRVLDADGAARHMSRWEGFVREHAPLPLSYHPAWPSVLHHGLRHRPYWLEVVEGGQTRGLLPLSFVRSALFGRHLVGLPYLNYGGILADNDESSWALIERAAALAEELDVRYLEFRHAAALEHPGLAIRSGHKVHMRLGLPGSVDLLWKGLGSSVRNQVRKAEKAGLTVEWGREDSLDAFYDVFSRNMRDLGTPVYGRCLFRSILLAFADRAELCIVRLANVPVAAALLLHGWGITEVPSASSIREHNKSCANMLMYWSLLVRAQQLGQVEFDFGRSSPDSSTFRFKKQWGAEAHSAHWAYVLRSGSPVETNRENPRYDRFIRTWQRLPLRLTRFIGPAIVRGIP